MLTEIERFVIDRVRKLRVEKNISQAELALSIGVSIGFIGKVESLKYNSKYNLNHINNIAKALNISPKQLLPDKSL
ncbi:helix-turn-helix domain-containing protein [Capnocytophaga catalasegens]|uniref:Transcriptional regulator n=1 Tax=Capnocytophaga catalasegens TaxID=1004260 RepID=A0AAV5ATZ7_9FLAO|nr:helix-turn-helix transcriptional regulator [Capnocytophaga catalasegens]GIZ14957.1 transcriptional regulator [Capnocytophaga catalasegens]GJM49336.1 transcriptional regulator [Capnocytophaga catalasegens]GJM52487.1 transcriptional regulator [Capnocytophaga catalasegens]